jgi:uncharacterized protein with ATP-grasp and redox domains
MEVVAAMLKFLGENFSDESVPSHIGTDRDLLVQRMTGKDPYEELKRLSNSMALSIFSELQELVDESETQESRFRKAALIAAAANAIEFDVSGRDFSLEELRDILGRVESDLVIDQVDDFRALCKDANEILYLMDNAGEIVLDMILLKEIRRLGPKVTAVVKAGPVLNDATMVDAEEVGLSSCTDNVMDTGAAAIGIDPERSSKKFLDMLYSSDLIVAKGMGNFESLTEFSLPSPVVHILRTKCLPVAQHIGVERNRNVVLIRHPENA